MSDEVRVRDADGVRRIALYRPQTRNGLTDEVNRAIADAVRAAPGAARCVLLTGDGGSFCSGADLRAALAGPPPDLATLERRMRDDFHGLIVALRRCPLPVVALVDGPAAGFGVSLAAACDLRIATDRAHFSVGFVRIGLCPDGGSTWTLPRLIGPGRAMELLMTGRRVGADEALRIGLVERVVPAERGEAEAGALCAALAQAPPLVLAGVKELVHAGLGGTLSDNLEGEVRAQVRCFTSADFAEGLAAFFAKREPRFRGE